LAVNLSSFTLSENLCNAVRFTFNVAAYNAFLAIYISIVHNKVTKCHNKSQMLWLKFNICVQALLYQYYLESLAFSTKLLGELTNWLYRQCLLFKLLTF
jgi:hypothetical protein